MILIENICQQSVFFIKKKVRLCIFWLSWYALMTWWYGINKNRKTGSRLIYLFWSRIYSSLGISKISTTPYTSVRRNTKFSSVRSVHMSVLPPSISVECISIHMIELYGICVRVGLTIWKKLIRKWLGDELTERHYLSQWPSIMTPCGIIGLQWH